MLIVVIEGCDGSGKTTLAREFEKHGFKYVHNGPPAPGVNVFQHYVEQIIEAAFSTKNTVFDRLHVGEIVYGTVIRQDPKLTIKQLRLLNAMLDLAGATIVFCQVDFATIKKTWESRQDREYVKNLGLMELVSQRYEEIIASEYDKMDLCCEVFNFQSQNVADFCKKIIVGGD